MDNNINNQNFNTEEEEIDIVNLIKNYIVYWPYYILGIVVALMLAFFYIYTTAPKYPVKMSVLFIDQKDNKSSKG